MALTILGFHLRSPQIARVKHFGIPPTSLSVEGNELSLFLFVEGKGLDFSGCIGQRLRLLILYDMQLTNIFIYACPAYRIFFGFLQTLHAKGVKTVICM
jgi:hypothetical protein